MQQHQHPDDRFALTGQEREQFRQIWKSLADEEPERADADAEDRGGTHPAWMVTAIACVVLVFAGLAANSVFLVLLGAGGTLCARAGLRRQGAAIWRMP